VKEKPAMLWEGKLQMVGEGTKLVVVTNWLLEEG
jgi:hypothetical protein